jgi:tRNA(Arg) A34 adenosine deaminase TadA
MLHAEVVALQNYARIANLQWDNLTLYSTAEPCPMCQSAILWCGIPETVYGTSIASLMAIGYRQIEISANEVVQRSWAAGATVVGGILEAECDALFERHKHPP